MGRYPAGQAVPGRCRRTADNDVVSLGADLKQPVPASPAGIALIHNAGLAVAQPARCT